MTRLESLAKLIFALIFFLPATASACSCRWGGPFFKVMYEADSIVRADIIAYAEEGRFGPEAMDVEVKETLGGKVYSGKLRIWGDNGMLCSPPVSMFPLGTQ